MIPATCSGVRAVYSRPGPVLAGIWLGPSASGMSPSSPVHTRRKVDAPEPNRDLKYRATNAPDTSSTTRKNVPRESPSIRAGEAKRAANSVAV